jgi:phosphohistidine phosphatase
MRHGIATQRSSPVAPGDARRPLTVKGKKKTERVAHGLSRLGYEVDWIVTSPLVRAVQTAEIVAGSFSARAPVDMCTALRPGGSPEDLLSFLAKNPDRRRILLVGHEPDLSELAARLIGAGSKANLTFKKAGCCCIRFDRHPSRATGQLVWWLTPRLLRALR